MPYDSPMTPMQQAVVALQAQRARIAELEHAATAPIAVVGLACRYPAGADTPDALWDAVRDGRDGSREVPPDRWDINAFYDPTPGRPGKMYVRQSCFINDVDQFEPLFFRISPREAIGIDPQQRLLLETTWQALEDAAISPSSLVGSQTGVFVGISTNDYSALLSRTAHGSAGNATAGAGNAASVASGRVSYTFGFQGPCMAIDTACSSSLVATHLAVQALRNRECGLAVVAGVNLMLTPDITVNFCQGRMLSPEGHCKTFDAGADGYARGEGCGVLVLKRLSEAVADGDRVLAVVRGSALNQDGRSAGLTAPNGLAQEAVIRKALVNAGLQPDAIDYVEAHGTGTALGDPIEMHAIKAVFAVRHSPLYVGSVKTNIGHTEAAAGVAGLIKAVQMLRHQTLPPSLHFSSLNPHIDLGGVDIRVPTSVTPAPLRAIGVSSFGFSGTNAHIILERADVPEPPGPEAGAAPRLFISARTEAALLGLIARYRGHLDTTSDSFADICHTAAIGRARFPWWVCVNNAAELRDAKPSNAAPPVLPSTSGRKVALPGVVFQRQRCWIDAPTDGLAAPAPEMGPGLPPLLGRRLSLPFANETRWEAVISPLHPALGFLADHRVGGAPVVPAACFVEMALAAQPGAALADLRIPAPLPVNEAAPRIVHTIVATDGTFRIVSCAADGNDQVLHASGRYVPSPPPLRLPATALLSTPVEAGALYDAMAARGVSHGQAFRLLASIRREDGHATATLLAAQGESCFALHPARLDAALQLVGAAMPDTGDESFVPSAIGRVVLHRVPAADATVHAFVRRDDSGIIADVTIGDAAGLAVEVSDLLFQPAASQIGVHEFYRIDWRPQGLTRGLPPPGFLPSATGLAAELDRTSADLAERNGTAAYAATSIGLEDAATAYVVRALRRLGLTLEAGAEFTFSSTAEALGVAERHHRLLRRMFGMLAADGILGGGGRRWQVRTAPSPADPDALLDSVLAEAPAMAGEIAVLRRCGAALADVLAARQEPLALLFPAEGDGAGVFYEASPYARAINSLLTEAARQIAARLPAGRVLRVLEAGAGTGGATGAMLAAVPRARRQYVFTDVSAGFLAAARQKFAGEGLEARLLDIERPPLDQGFAAGEFDLVLAANVLHATADVRRSLEHLHMLLAPGGVLLLVESTEPRRWVDIVFGLTEGWWRFTDTALRPDHPLLSGNTWRQVLGEAGFETAEGTSEVIVARRPPMATALPADVRIHAVPPTEATEAAQVELLYGLTRMAADAAATVPPQRLILIGDDSLGHAGLGGFLRTVAVEAPQLRPRLLLAPPGAEAAHDDILAEPEETEVRWDISGQRLVPRLVPAAIPLAPAKVDGCWLITGASGGVAQAIAGWLASHGASAIVLLSRHLPETPAEVGVPVHVYAGDAADAGLIARLLRDHDVRGVVHAAGLLCDAALADQDELSIKTVAHAKIGGAMALDRATRAHPVQHFILCASAAGILGSARQVNHAFCSTFLDGLAARRRADGLPGLSLDWGVWSGTGSAAALGFDARAEQIGLGSITPAQGVALFGRAANAGSAQLAVLPSVDWPRFTSHFGTALPGLLREVAAAPPAFPVRVVPGPAPHPDAGATLTKIVAACLGLSGPVDPDTPLHDLGLDSLVAVEIRNRAERELGLAVSVRELIEGASIRSLLKHAPQRFPAQPAVELDSGAKLGAIVAVCLGLTGPADPDVPLHDLGLDSLVAVEIRNRAERELGLTVSVRDLIEGATIRSLLRPRPAATHAPAEAPVGTPLAVPVGAPDLANRYAPFPLTDMQMAYYLGRRDDIALGSVSCYLYTEFDTDTVDVARAEAAWNALIVRHDMLRLVIRRDGTQQILQHVPRYRFETLDLRARDAAAELERLRGTLPGRIAEPDAWPLFDIRATRFDGMTRLHMGFDLIALDAASIHALRREWGQLYDNPAAVLPPIGFSFRDVVMAQIAARDTPAWRRSEAYWKARAGSLPGGPELPVLTEQAGRTSRRFRRRGVVIAAPVAAEIRRQARTHGVTLPVLLAAAYADILAAWSRGSRFCITVTSFNRPDLHPDIRLVLGDYTSTILLEANAALPSFSQRARALADQLADDLEHAEVGGIQVLREIAKQTSTAAPTIPVVFTSALGFSRPGSREVPDAGSGGWDRLGTTVYNVSSTPQVLIDQQVSEEDGRLFCNWDVAEDLFPAGVVDQMVAAYERLLHAVADGSGWDRTVAAALPARSRAGLLPVPAPELLHAAFERHARTAPRRIALIAPDRELDYGTLDAAATVMAAGILHRLNGAPRDRLVAVVFPKGWRQIVAVLAILKAGAAYLPIDPALPEARRRQLIERSEAIVLDDPSAVDAALTRGPQPVLPPVDDPERLAYVIYTSGSTGQPKGVMIEHRAALTTVREINRRWSIGPEDRCIGLSSLSFDLSVYDIFGPLSAGGALVLPPAEATRDPAAWSDLLTRHRVTIWNSVPALMAMQTEYGLPAGHAVRLVMLSGDWVPLELIGRLRQQASAAKLVALGGATEAAIWSNAHEVSELDPDWPSIPYGTPLAGQMLHVVNGRGEAAPDWVAGEIEISGAGLARGYWRDPAQTAERFRTDTLTGERRYRTGDLGRFRPYRGASGPTPIEFLGREDFQVKVQGHRIELGEVEAALAAHPAVIRAVATAPVSANGQGRTLHAFVVPRQIAEAATPFWQDLCESALAEARRLAKPIDRDAFDLTAAAFTDQAAAAAAAGLHRLTGSYELPDADALIRQHHIAPRYRFWLERMLPEVARVGMAATAVSSHDLSGVDRFGFTAPALDFLDRVIATLPEILTERAHSSAIYLDRETPDIYARLFAGPNALIGSVITTLAANRTLSVLEIGGGLGTTLSAVEAALPSNRISWHFTDVNQHLLRAAKTKFADRPWLSFASLDFDQPPASQHLGRYDVIIASNALHVAADVAVTLRHLRACLAHGGVLVALEQTRFFPWFDLGMGLQSGFDSRTDLALRPLHPLLTRNTWARVLTEAGFTATAVPAVPGSLEDLMGFDVILALGDTPAPADGALADSLRDHLRASLPAYMVPSTIDLIDRVPLSPNGKVDRRALVPAASTRTADRPSPAIDRLLRQVTEVVAEVMQQDNIDPDRSLFELGASSLTLVSLQRLLGERIGRTLPLQRIFEAPTAAAFATAIASGEAATTALVSFGTTRDADDRPKLLMMPGMFALPFYLRDMAAAVAEHLDVVSVQLPGLAAGETPIGTIEDQASYVIDRMRAAGLAPPYLIGGHSFGGHVAIAVARRLRDSGQAVPLLLLGDTVRTYSDFKQLQTDELAFTAMTRGLAALYGARVHPAPEGLTAEEAFRHTASQMQQSGLFGALELPLDRMAAVFKANFRAIGTARPGPIPGDLAVIRTEGGFPPEFLQFETGEALNDPALGWSDLVQGRISTRIVPGDHLAMLTPANLPALAASVVDLTREALARHVSASVDRATDPEASVSSLWRALQRRRGNA